MRTWGVRKSPGRAHGGRGDVHRILSPSRAASGPPTSPWASPIPPSAPRPVQPRASLAGPFPGEAGVRGRPFPAAHLGTSLGPPRSGSFSHFTSH